MPDDKSLFEQAEQRQGVCSAMLPTRDKLCFRRSVRGLGSAVPGEHMFADKAFALPYNFA